MKDVIEILLHPLNTIALLLAIIIGVWIKLDDAAASIVLFVGCIIVTRAVGWLVQSLRSRDTARNDDPAAGGDGDLDG